MVQQNRLPRAAVLAAVILLGISVAARVTCSEGDATIPVNLEMGAAGSRLAPRYSPKGFRVKLTATEREVPEGHDALEGRLLLGPEAVRGDGHLVVVARSEPEKPFDRLWLDTDADGSLEDEEVRTATPRLSRTSFYTSFDAVLQVNHGTVEAPGLEPYAIGLWIAVASEEATPPFVRFSRRSFLSGAATIDEVAYHVLLSDANNDAVYGAGDWWVLLPARGGELNMPALSRKVGDFAWARRRAFLFDLEGTNGRKGRLVATDPGLTPEEDARARDPYWDDKHAARAEAPVAFRRDIEAALAEARHDETVVFLDFETTWCGPCKSMDQWVYSAKDVVAATEGIVCIKVDGDDHPDLKESHEVTAFPTGILIGKDGEEIARFRGYQSVAEVVAFFAKARVETDTGD